MKWLILVALVACQSKSDDKPKDPWDTTPAGDADAPPTLGERTRMVNEECPAVTNPFFFEVKKDGRTAHILGTRHISVGLDKFPQVVRDEVDAASLAVFEVPPDDKVKPVFKPEPLREELGDQWAHYETLVGKSTAKRMEKQAPVVGMLAMIAMYEDISVFLDKQIEARVAEKKIPTGGFETSKFQIDVLGKLLDAKMFKAMVAETPDRAKLKQLSHDAIVKYCTGVEHEDDDMLDAVEPEKLAKYGYTKADLERFKDVLLYRRNADWIPKLEKLFEQDKVFVAVGAGHLQGPRGVIELLKKDGYEIRRIAK